mgnify:CR=1 FL=1
MEQSKKQKTTQEDLPKDIRSDWKEIVWERNNVEHRFWEDSWNKEIK